MERLNYIFQIPQQTRWAIRELRHQKLIAFVLVLSLSLGLTGYVVLDSFKIGIENYLQNNSRQSLSADLAVSVRRSFTQTENDVLNDLAKKSERSSQTFEMFAMAAHGEKSRLVLLKAIDQKYPLYGKLSLSSGAELKISSQPEVFVYPEVRSQLEVQVGDKLRIGSMEFTVKDVVQKDDTQTFRLASLAPRIFMNRDLIKAAGLLQYGSTFTESRLFAFSQNSDVGSLRTQLLQQLPDPGISVESYVSAAEDSNRQLGFLNDFLGLTALVALLLAAIGCSYLARLIITRNLKTIAIYRALGLKARDAVMIFFIQAVLMSLVSLPLIYLLSQAAHPIFIFVMKSVFAVDFNFKIEGVSFLKAAGLAILMTVWVIAPWLRSVRLVSVKQLLGEGGFSAKLDAMPWEYIFFGVGFFFLISVVQAHSWKIGSLFVAGIFVAAVLMVLAFKALSWLLGQIRFQSWQKSYIAKALVRKGSGTLVGLVALTLSVLLLCLPLQIERGLKDDLSFDPESKRPSLFLFDIQDEQLAPLKEFLAQEKIPDLGASAMIRARIAKVNGQDFERQIADGKVMTREEERDLRMRNRGVNLTYRDELFSSEQMVSGRGFSPKKSDTAEISVEQRYAERLGLKIGDEVIFDVQGVEVKSVIVNLRKVKWTSFQPNFFIVMQSGFLEDAPKTNLLALKKSENLEVNEIQNRLNKRFPNISAIDLKRTVDDVLRLASQMGLALQAMSALSLVLGFLILFSVIALQWLDRRRDLQLTRLIGAKPSDTIKMVDFESLLLLGTAGVVGVVLSYFVAESIGYFGFNASISAPSAWLLVVLAVLMVLGMGLGRLIAKGIFYE